MPRLLELFCGTKSAFKAAGWEVVSLDIVSKFEPTILCDIRSWDYTTFPGHFDMVWASPVCTEYSRALTTLEGDALVLSALEIIAHFDPLMWVIENPATGPVHGAPALGGRDLLQLRTGSRRGCGPTCAGGRGEACAGPAAAARRGRTAGTSGPRSGGRLMEGQYERVSQSRELLYSVLPRCARRLRARPRRSLRSG